MHEAPGSSRSVLPEGDARSSTAPSRDTAFALRPEGRASSLLRVLSCGQGGGGAGVSGTGRRDADRVSARRETGGGDRGLEAAVALGDAV